MARHSLTITSWSGSESPALEAIREGQDHHPSQSDGSAPYATDAHRRRRSDSSQLSNNRGRLVMGILEALRDNDDAPSDKKISAGPSSFTTPGPSVTVSAHPHVPLKDTQADSIAKPRPASMATPTQWANASPALESAHGSELQMGITHSGTTAISAATPVTIPTIATTAYAPGGSPIARRRDPDAPAPPPKPTPVANGGNLRRTSRSESVYSQDNMDLSSSTSDNGSIFSSSSRRTSLVPATPIISSPSSVTAAANTTKGARRPSKLFGKLVPKFLQTSHSSSTAPAPSSTTGTSPPRSSHATAPSSHSTTLIAHSPTLPSLPGVVNVSLDFHEDWLAPDSTADVADSEPVATPREPSRSQKVAAATAAAAESRNMPNRHSMPAAPSFVSQMWRLSSQADDLKPALESEGAVVETSEEDRETVMRRPNSMIKVEVTCEVEEKQRPSSVYKIEVQYEEEEEKEEEEEEEEEKKDKDGKDSDNQTHSPYIIDESCDDDFFLKSVLHKTHQSPQQRLLRTEGSGTRNWSSSSYSFSSTNRTPSLSPSLTWSSSSPTSSATPSPTTPMFAPATAASSLVMIQQGLDEKRSRLSDAVKEWRRSVNLSTDSDSSMVYTGYA
ncbi:hypothetical protein BGZ99_006841 [Dissophora globulifera]|uniref:Uncharacterized protein n=1 Tax=Dissophora globulifera TaxID=979702 RepID=A0A9P6URK4_9FUNG|nr:hypothetical protein BGZ99_006841 [Dissophora globulifera]